MPALLCEFVEVGENQPEYIARIIKWVTTLEVYQEELVDRTMEGTVSSAFPAFQRSNLAIFRGKALLRKIGVRAAQSAVFHAATTTQKNSFKYFVDFSYLRTTRTAYQYLH